MVISHNLKAMNASRQYNIVTDRKSKSLEKLSSGYRINRAADDAAGLAISEKMRRQIKGLSQGISNTQDGISVCQIADGALSEVNDMLHRINQLSIQASNDTLNQGDREAIQAEIGQLTDEISTVGRTTTFNEIRIFDLGTGKTKEGVRKMDLIKSESANTGMLSEAYKVGSTYYPAAIMDFSALNPSSIALLADKSFSFTCSQACAEVFSFKFVDGDGTGSKFVNPGTKGMSVQHDYEIDIHNAKSGKDVLAELFNTVVNDPPREAANGNQIKVSHSNIMIKEGDTKLVIRATTGGNSNPQKAIDDFVNSKMGTGYGKADFAEIIGSSEKVITNIMGIQYGAEQGHLFDLEIERMNAQVIGVSDINVLTENGRKDAIGKTKEAMYIINHQRAKIGAQQNRLEHIIKNETNVVENTTAAESRIRDTDMATEMVQFSLHSTLEQAGMQMMAQANQSNQSVLSLLQ